MGKLCLSTAGDGRDDGVSDDLRGLILRGLRFGSLAGNPKVT